MFWEVGTVKLLSELNHIKKTCNFSSFTHLFGNFDSIVGYDNELANVLGTGVLERKKKKGEKYPCRSRSCSCFY